MKAHLLHVWDTFGAPRREIVSVYVTGPDAKAWADTIGALLAREEGSGVAGTEGAHIEVWRVEIAETGPREPDR